MDSKQLSEFVDKIKFQMELGGMYNDMCELKRLLYVILLIKDKINEGDIAKSVNVAI